MSTKPKVPAEAQLLVVNGKATMSGAHPVDSQWPTSAGKKHGQ